MGEEGEATVESPGDSHSSVFAGDWLTGPPRIPDSPGAQVPCVKWCGICIQIKSVRVQYRYNRHRPNCCHTSATLLCFEYVLLIHNWLNLWVQNPWIWRAVYNASCKLGLAPKMDE